MINLPFFKNLNSKEINDSLSKISYSKSKYKKNSYIAFEGDPIYNIGFILSGSVDITKLYPSGKSMIITTLKKDDVFGEVVIFSNTHQYPSTILCSSDCEILFISKTDMLKLCSINSFIMQNFMSLLSNKILLLNKKLKIISYKSIRQKVSSYLLDEYIRQKKLCICAPPRQEMADLFSVARPSLSRELSSMQNDNIIKISNKNIIIKDLNMLENCLFT